MGSLYFNSRTGIWTDVVCCLPLTGPADVARYISTRMASSKAAARDGDAHTKYALALLAASRDDSNGATSR